MAGHSHSAIGSNSTVGPDVSLHLLNSLGEELDAWLAERGYPRYRAPQIRRWLLQSRCATFDEMSDLPQKLRAELSASFSIWSADVKAHHQSRDGTEKLVLQVADGGTIECVLLRDGARRTICISSQVGCAMGCVFCASGIAGVDRSLTRGEILEQMLRLQRLLPTQERLSHIVVMGMGEPLANLPHLLWALEWARVSDGLAISARRITISTVGLPDAMRRLAEQPHPYELAISLHAATDELRNQLVRVNRQTGLAAILQAADDYYQASKRRLTFEYVLLAGINDQPLHAQALARRLVHRNALLNVIPFNRVADLPYQTPTDDAVERFCQIVAQAGINVQVRRRKGDDIHAACGQLRRLVQQNGSLPPTPALLESPS